MSSIQMWHPKALYSRLIQQMMARSNCKSIFSMVYINHDDSYSILSIFKFESHFGFQIYSRN